MVTADSVDGAALSAFQYFENVRNFLVASQEIGLPCFEASDLEQVRSCRSRTTAPTRPCLQLQQSAYHGIFALDTHTLSSWSWSCDPDCDGAFSLLPF